MKQTRNTRQKKMVLDAVNVLCSQHPSADEIYLYLRNIDDKISRGTVYRNLNNLVDSNEITKVKISNVERFDCITELHYHLLCKTCGKLMDLDLPYTKDIDQIVEKETKYKIDRHKMLFEGTCPNCQKIEKNENPS